MKGDKDNVMVMWQGYITLSMKEELEKEATALGVSKSKVMRNILADRYNRTKKQKP